MKFTYLESERLFKVGNLTAGVSVNSAAAARNNDDRRSASSICAAVQLHAAARNNHSWAPRHIWMAMFERRSLVGSAVQTDLLSSCCSKSYEQISNIRPQEKGNANLSNQSGWLS